LAGLESRDVHISIHLPDVLNGVDDTGRRPGSEGVVGVERLEPGREGAGVAATDDHPVKLLAKFSRVLVVHSVDEVCQVSESLI